MSEVDSVSELQSEGSMTDQISISFVWLTQAWMGVIKALWGVTRRSFEAMKGCKGAVSQRFELLALCESFSGLVGYISGSAHLRGETDVC